MGSIYNCYAALKGDTGDPMNYRPISLLNVSMKIFMQLITNRINLWAEKMASSPKYKLGSEQAEVVRNRYSTSIPQFKSALRRKRKYTPYS
jgi:hypothetical protein